MNKKGKTFSLTKEWVFWILQAIVVFVILGFIFVIIQIPSNLEFKIDGLKHSLLRQHLIYDVNCLAYQDERVYPGIIDINKFRKENLEKCFQTESNGVMISLNYNGMKDIKLNEKLNKFEFCFNKDNFYCTNRTFYVLVYDKNKFENGLLNIAILNQK